MPKAVTFLVAIAAAYVLLAVLVWVFQRRLQYFPDRSPVPLPAPEASQGLQAVSIGTADGERIEAWYWPSDGAPCFVLFHGNAGHRGHRIDWIRALHALGGGVLAIDYRGYGGSSGRPTETGLCLDGEAAVRWLEERGVRELVYVGESLGAGVAVELALRRRPAALLLHGSYSSLVPVAQRGWPWLPVGLLMKDRFECASKVAQLGVPILFAHGERDRVVPAELGRELYEAAGEPKEWWLVPGAGHDDVPHADLPAWSARAAEFLARHGVGG